LLTGLIALLACQLVGEVLVRVLDVPFPGPVVGMVLMLAVLQLRRPAPDADLTKGAEVLLRYLPMLYVPAGVGVVGYLTLLRDSVVPVVSGLALSWLAGLLVTAATAAVVLRLGGQRRVTR
jgi:holin-like protein